MSASPVSFAISPLSNHSPSHRVHTSTVNWPRRPECGSSVVPIPSRGQARWDSTGRDAHRKG